ncbi:MAG: pyridoxal phosphate-dependent aminotransferase [Candidatus Omnitrophica bacterium]|nr:pyridoxal phosphate-dependent aminotransferase [Candidatus Omnitrophota bacterium]
MPTKYNFSSRTSWEFKENELSILLKGIRAEGEIIDLTRSNPTNCGFKYDSKIVKSLSGNGKLFYEPSPKGSIRAREAVADYYKKKNIEISPEDIFLTSSTSEAYSFVFRLLLDPQEMVLLPSPSYPLFQYLCGLNDVETGYYRLHYNGEWRIDFSCLSRLLAEEAKALVMVNPNNPTGSYIKADEMVKLNEICRKNNLALICDEVFHDFSLSREKNHISFAGNRDCLTFTLSGISKILALPQMKISWIVISGPSEAKEEAKKRLEIIADTYLSVNTPAQNALKSWFELKDGLQSQILNRIKINYAELSKQVQGSKYALLNSEGGWYAVLRLPDNVSEEDWSLKLLKCHKVFVHPGYFFDFSQGNHVVLSLLCDENDFAEGVKIIKTAELH